MSKKYNLYEALKERKLAEEQNAIDKNNGEIALDDISRVKVLSPARKVFKRFMRNRLAVVGAAILITMFVFSFIGPIFYAYAQDEVFYKYDSQRINYSQAKELTSYTGYNVAEGVKIDNTINNMMNSHIKSLNDNKADSLFAVNEGQVYRVEKVVDNAYLLSLTESKAVCSAGVVNVKVGVYSRGTKSFTPDPEAESIPENFESALQNTKMGGSSGEIEIDGETYSYERGSSKTDLNIFRRFEGIVYTAASLGEAFENDVYSAIENAEGADIMSAEIGGKTYVFERKGDLFDVHQVEKINPARIYTRYTLVKYDNEADFSDQFRYEALNAAKHDGKFKSDGKDYTIQPKDELLVIKDGSGNEVAEFSVLSIRRYSGQDTMDYELKNIITDVIDEMNRKGEKTADFKAIVPRQDVETGQVVYDENGKMIMDETQMHIQRSDTGVYNITCDQIIYLIDMYADPSGKHILGTDGDGFDVFARIMYGGRVSLMVGFVVVFLETFLGVIMGGIAGYYGKWVDMIIMRLVDIFYCIPSLPILIILGVLMDYLRLNAIIRLIVMMAVLGLLGWAGVARLVRGQILSLREQEFMVAAEATGVKVNTRIFKHLIPNVMPQLIVTATMGMGGVILTESTLSFLGLGVKHPLATWGTMINSVSSQTAMEMYPYIWIPVGLLICITVVAFNFVGDGLRDAYDPKSKK